MNPWLECYVIAAILELKPSGFTLVCFVYVIMPALLLHVFWELSENAVDESVDVI